MDRNPDFWFMSAVAFSAIFIIFNYMIPFGSVLSEKPKIYSGKIISDVVKRGESLFIIFKRHGLDMDTLFEIKEASASVHEITDINAGQPYTICIDNDNRVNSLAYRIDEDFFLNIERTQRGFQAQRRKVPYESRTLTVSGPIGHNLISSVGEDRESFLLAMKLAELFETEIDFTSDLQPGDTYSIVVEGLYLDGSFRKYGEVLSAELVNAGSRHAAYRFELDGKAGYFDAEGKSLKKSFLMAPLSFRRISSYFTHKRLHPVLRTYRPHRGVDYAAATGTPVSATGDGTVSFSGRRGQYGNLVTINHPNGYTTCYGHLSRISRGIRPGCQVRQGDIIGFVGATGLASGPHLHYEVRRGGNFVNPLAVKGESGRQVPRNLLYKFRAAAARMDKLLASGNSATGQLPEEAAPGMAVSQVLKLYLL